jgi:serine/threonine protein kinase
MNSLHSDDPCPRSRKPLESVIPVDNDEGSLITRSIHPVSIQDFPIIRELGRGSHATVYLAQDLSGQQVAIRTIAKSRDYRGVRGCWPLLAPRIVSLFRIRGCILFCDGILQRRHSSRLD